MIDWTQVIVALIAAVPSSLGLVVVLLNRRSLRTPSGDPIGHVAERAEHATHADVALTTRVLATVDGMKDKRAGA